MLSVRKFVAQLVPEGDRGHPLRSRRKLSKEEVPRSALKEKKKRRPLRTDLERPTHKEPSREPCTNTACSFLPIS